jgi:hypothetical protein
VCKKRHRDVFFAHHGPGPYVCVFCDAEVQAWWDSGLEDDRHKDALIIHHRNGDHDDNTPGNLTPSHYGCHTKHHKLLNPLVPKGSKLSDAHRLAIIEGGRKWRSLQTDEERVAHKIAARHGLRGVDKTPATCDCGAGPFRGPQGLAIHQARGKCLSIAL